MTDVRQCVPRPTQVLHARSLETGEEALVLTSPYYPSDPTTRTACGALTDVGEECRRSVLVPGEQCWQHR